MFILRHLLHAAQTKKPHGSPRLHAAFTDFRQAYDSIPRCALWEHLQRNCMPTCLLNSIQILYNADEYVLVDGIKQARVRPTRGVKQGCPLSSLLFSLYIKDVDCIARDVRGSVTGIADVCVTHMLYADDLSLTANEPGRLQMMLDRLSACALRKGLIVNTLKSEVMHFNSQCKRVTVFALGGLQLPIMILLNIWAWSSPRRTIWLLQLSICLRFSWLVVIESGTLHRRTACDS